MQCIQGKGQHDYVFTRDNGTPIRDFRKSWHNVCHAAGTPGLLFHDLRRSAARNLRNQGTAEEVIMKIGGWHTASVFKRYSIVSQSDIADAMGKLGAGQQQVAQEQAEQFGQGLGRVAAQSTDSRIALPLPTPLFN